MRRKLVWITGVVSLIAIIVSGVFLLRAPQSAHADAGGVSVSAVTIPNTFGGQSVLPSAINNAGLVVGTADTGSGDGGAFIWDSAIGGALTPLPDLTPSSSSALDINAHGQIVGSSDGQPVEWLTMARTSVSPPTPLSLPVNTTNGSAVAINDQGQIRGIASNADGMGVLVFWRSSADVGVTLANPSSNLSCSVVIPGGGAMNNQGEIVGVCTSADGSIQQGYYWQSVDAVPVQLPPSPLAPDASPLVTAINNLGHSVGISEVSAIQAHAMLWSTPTSLPLDLGAAVPPTTLCSDCSIAYGVNDEDQAVGYAYPFGGTLFESGDVIQLTSSYCTGASWADDINDVGQAIGYTFCGDGLFWTITGSPPLPTPTPILPTPTPVPVQLTAVSPANIWIGLKNSDDVGLHFDLRAEVYVNGTLVTSGEVHSVAGGSSGFNNARLDSIPFDSFAPVSFPSGSTLSLKLYVRNTCTGPSHNAGTARLWFNDSAANSSVGATIGGTSSPYYMVDGSLLSPTVGAGSKKTIDVAAGAPCSVYKLIGTWAVTP